MELNKIDLNKLNTFFSVVESNGISAASRKLFLTRSAVSQSISSLESLLDLKLFNRVGKKFVLTAEGKILYRRFKDYQDNLQQTLREITSERKEVKGLIRVGAFPGFSKTKLIGFMARFIARYPSVKTKLIFSTPTELNSALSQNRIDLALSVYPSSARAEDGIEELAGRQATDSSHLMATRLFEEELVLIGSRKFFKEKITIRDLMRIPVVDYYQNCLMIRSWIKHHFQREPGLLNVVSYAGSADVILDLVLRQVGVGVVPLEIAEPYLVRGELFHFRTQQPELTDSVWLNELKSSYRSPAHERFRTELIREYTLS